MELSIHQGTKGIVIEEKKEMLSIKENFYGGMFSKENSLEMLRDAHELSVSKTTEWISREDKVLYTAFEWLLSKIKKQSRELVETISDYYTKELAEFIYQKKREDYKILGIFYFVPSFVKHESFMCAKKLMETLMGIYELDDTYKQFALDVGMTYESTIKNTRDEMETPMGIRKMDDKLKSSHPDAGIFHESKINNTKTDMKTPMGIYELDDTYKRFTFDVGMADENTINNTLVEIKMPMGILEVAVKYNSFPLDVGMTYESTINNTRGDVQNNVAKKNNSTQVKKKIDETKKDLNNKNEEVKKQRCTTISMPETKFSSKEKSVIAQYPRFADDYQTLIDNEYMCKEDNGCLKWLKSKKCLGEYFDSIKTSDSKNNNWVVVEALFNTKNLKNSFSKGALPVKKTSRDFEKLKKILHLE